MNMRLIAIQSYLYVAACALMSLGGISLLSFGFAEQADSFSLLLMPSLAVSLLFAGAIILSTIQRRGRLSLAFLVAMAAVVLSVVLPVAASGAYAFWGSGRNADELHWPLALSYLAGASAVVMSMGARALRWAARLVGLVLVTLAGGVLLKITAFEPGYAFGPLLGTVGYFPTLLLGMAAVLLTFSPFNRARSSPLKTVLVAGATALLSCVVFYIAVGHAYQSLNRHSDLLLSEVQKSTQRALREQLALLDRMAERWESLGHLPGDEYWRQEATSYLRDIPSLRLIGLVDGDSRVLRLESQEPTDAQWLQQFLTDSMLRQWLEHAWHDKQPHLSKVLSGTTISESELLMVAPVAIAGQVPYQLIASVNVREVMNAMLGGIISGLALRVMQGDELIYETDSVAPHLISYPVGEREIDFHHDQRWRVVSYIGNAETYPSAVLPTVVLLFGLVLSFFLTLSQQLTAVARVHGKRLQDANSTLASSLAEQKKVQLLNQRIMQFTMDVFCSFDSEGRFREVSPSCFKLFGFRPEELIGRSCLELVLPEDRESTRNQTAAVKSGSASYAFHNRYRHKDGRILHLLWSAEWSEPEQILFAVAHDVTGLIQGEQFAEHQRTVLGMICRDRPKVEILEAICRMVEAQMEDALCSILLSGVDGRFLFTAAAPSLPVNFSSAIDGLPVGPDDDGRGLSVYQQTPIMASDFEDGHLWRRGRAQAQSLGILGCGCMPLISHRGNVLGALVVYFKHPVLPVAEMSDQLATASNLASVAVVHARDRRKLEENEQHFRSLFTFNPDAVFSFDRSGVFQSINAAGSELIGLTEPEIVGRHFSNWVIEPDLIKTERSFSLACEGTPQRYELQIRNRTGQLRYLDVSNLPIMVGGEIVGVFGIAKDVTQRERMTAELRKALQQSKKQTEQLSRLGHAAIETAQCHDHQTLINYLVEQVRLTVGAHQAVISLTQGSDWGQAISGFSVSEKYANWRDYDSVPTGEGIYALVCETNEPIVLSQHELERHPRWRGFGSQAEHHPPMRGWIAAPLVAQDGSNIGLLQLSDKEDGEFGPDDLAVIQQYAQMVVSIVENNRLMAEVLDAEQRLKAQLSFTSAITDCMAEGLLAVDHEGRLRFINPAVLRWLAVANESDIIGQSMAAILPLNPENWIGDRPELNGELQLFGRTLMFEARPLIGRDDGGGWVVALRDMTDQLRADQALRERDQFFSLSLEMFCMVSLDGHFIQVNPSFTDTLRRTTNELIGSAYIDLVDQEDRSLIDDAVQTLQQGGQIQDLVVRVWDGQQVMHWLQLSAALGADRVIYCVARDITEQRAIQQQLVQRNLILSLAGETAKLGGWIIDLPDMQVIWSREIFSLLRFPQSYVPTLAETLALCPNEHREAVALALDACMTEGRSFDLDVQIHDGGNTMLDVRLTGRAVCNESGEIRRISGALQDISERKQAQRELQRLAERMSSTLESITDAFITVDNDWRFTYVNSEAATLLRTGREILIGQTIWSAFPDLRPGEIGKRYLEAKNKQQAVHFETYYAPLNSWFEIHAYPSDEGLAVYFRDISERKTTERELDRAIRELERSNRELQEFAFVASHDLQEPLRKIQTFSERLQARSERLDENDRDYLQRMSLAASRMQALILDLLDYSRVNSRGQPLCPLMLDTVVDDVLNDLEEKIAQTRTQIERSPLPRIMGDASQLRQVVQNLISNAIKFQPPGQIPVVKIYAEDSSGNTVTLCVADNGIGFDEKYTSKIFNPFQRLHGKEVYAGTGIGLAIVKKVIDRHGATIVVSSAPGKGSVFRITFPKTEAAVDAD